MSAITFTKKTYSDTASSGSGLVAADMNKIEQAIVDLNNAVTKLQDSVSQSAVAASGWITGSDQYAELTVCGRVVTLNMRICHSGPYGSDSTVCTVPEGLRPKRELAFTVLSQGTGSESAPCIIYVGADGVVEARPYMSNPWWVIGAATWVI